MFIFCFCFFVVFFFVRLFCFLVFLSLERVNWEKGFEFSQMPYMIHGFCKANVRSRVFIFRKKIYGNIKEHLQVQIKVAGYLAGGGKSDYPKLNYYVLITSSLV